MSFIDTMSEPQLMLLTVGIISILSLAAYYFFGDILDEPIFNPAAPGGLGPAVSNQQLAALTRAISCLQIQLINIEQVTDRTEAALSVVNADQNVFHTETRQYIANSRDEVIRTTANLFIAADRRVNARFDQQADQATKDYERIMGDIALNDSRVERVRTIVDETRTNVETLRGGMRDHFMCARQVIIKKAADIRTDIADLKTDLDSITLDVADVNASVEELKNDISDVEGSLLEAGNFDRVEVMRRVHETAVKLESFIVDLFQTADEKADRRQDDTDSRLADMESLQNETKDSLDVVAEDVTEIKTGVADIKTATSAIDDKLTQGFADLKKKIETVDQQITELRKDLPLVVKKSQRELITKIDEDSNKLNTNLHKIRDEIIGEFNTNLHTIRDEIIAVAKEGFDDVFKAINEDIIAILNDLNRNLEGRIKDLRNDVRSIDKSIMQQWDALRPQLVDMRNNLTGLRTNGAGMLGLVGQFIPLVEELTIRITELEGTVQRCCGHCHQAPGGGDDGDDNDDGSDDDAGDEGGADDADDADDAGDAGDAGDADAHDNDDEIEFFDVVPGDAGDAGTDGDADAHDDAVEFDYHIADAGDDGATLVPFGPQQPSIYQLPVNLSTEKSYLVLTRLDRDDLPDVDSLRYHGVDYIIIPARLFESFARVRPGTDGFTAVINPQTVWKALKAIAEQQAGIPMARGEWQLYRVSSGSFNDVYFLQGTGGRVIVRLPLKSSYWTTGDEVAMDSAFRLTNLLAILGLKVPRTFYADRDAQFLSPIRLSIEEYMEGGDAWSIWWVDGTPGDFELRKRHALLKGLAEQMAMLHHNQLWARKMGFLDPDVTKQFDAVGGWPTVPFVRYGSRSDPCAMVGMDFFQGPRATSQATFSKASEWRNDVYDRWWRMRGGKWKHYFGAPVETEEQETIHNSHGIDYAMVNALKECLNWRTDKWVGEESDGKEKFHLGHMDLDLQNTLPTLSEDENGGPVVELGLIDWDDAKFMPADRGYFSYPMWILKPFYIPAHVSQNSFENPHTDRVQLKSYRTNYARYLSRALGNTTETRALVKKYTFGSHIARMWDDTMERIIGGVDNNHLVDLMASVLEVEIQDQLPQNEADLNAFWWHIAQYGIKHARQDEIQRVLRENEMTGEFTDEEVTRLRNGYDEANYLGTDHEVAFLELKEMIKTLFDRP